MATLQQTYMLQQKLAQLQAENIIYQDEISRLRKKVLSLQEYRIKYELLLEKQSEESPLHRSRRMDEINNMNRKIDENNEKWGLKVKLMEGKYEKVVNELEEKNKQLMKEVEGLRGEGKSTENIKLRTDFSELKALRQQVQTLKSSNNNLIQQINTLKQYQPSTIPQQKLEQRLQQARQQQKQFYRQKITELQTKLTSAEQQAEYHKVRASPERQQQISRLIQEIKRIESEQDEQIARFNQLIRQQKIQMHHLAETLSTSKQQSLDYTQTLSKQLQQLRHRLLDQQQSHQMQLLACRQEMQLLRQQEVDLLKKSFQKIQNTHDAERQQWKLILKDQEQQLERIRKMWDQERQKFAQEKNKLKVKINQMKDREKRSAQGEKERTDNETFKLIQSLRQIDEEENKYNDYESSVTFLARQLKRATAKIEEKQRQCAKLLNQLKTQHQEFDTETEFIKKVQRQQVNFYKQKLLQADEQNSRLLQQLRDKQKYIRDKEAQSRLNQEKIRKQNEQLNDIIRELQRDYNRLSDNKKNLYQSYRSQRDMVFTGKAELNQERKNKWLHLDRQKNELQIAYKEREKQIRIQYELRINQLNEKITKISKDKELAAAEVDILKERVDQNAKVQRKGDRDDQKKQFQKKLATLDLEISLTQNLFDTIKHVRQRTSSRIKRSQLDQISQHQSQSSLTSNEQKIRDLQNESLNTEEFEKDNVAPTFSKSPNKQHEKREEEYQNFSFKPQEAVIKVTKVNKNRLEEESSGDKTPGWGM